jgi:hypothetical protein
MSCSAQREKGVVEAGRDHGPVLAGHFGHGPAQTDDLPACLVDVPADVAADLDLGLHELRFDSGRPGRRGPVEELLDVRDQTARLGIDELVLSSIPMVKGGMSMEHLSRKRRISTTILVYFCPAIRRRNWINLGCFCQFRAAAFG